MNTMITLLIWFLSTYYTIYNNEETLENDSLRIATFQCF